MVTCTEIKDNATNFPNVLRTLMDKTKYKKCYQDSTLTECSESTHADLECSLVLEGPCFSDHVEVEQLIFRHVELLKLIPLGIAVICLYNASFNTFGSRRK